MSTVGENILLIRKQLGWTQEELANKMGYKSKSTINKIELGINDIPQSKIVKFAKVLGVSPARLMGWEEDTTKALPTDEKSLTDEEQKWLELFRQLPESSQSAALLLFDLFEKVPEENQQMVLGMIQVALRKK